MAWWATGPLGPSRPLSQEGLGMVDGAGGEHALHDGLVEAPIPHACSAASRHTRLAGRRRAGGGGRGGGARQRRAGRGACRGWGRRGRRAACRCGRNETTPITVTSHASCLIVHGGSGRSNTLLAGQRGGGLAAQPAHPAHSPEPDGGHRDGANQHHDRLGDL